MTAPIADRPKLTTLQRTTLSDIGHDAVSERKFGYGAWRIQGGNPGTVGKLVKAGLAEWGPYHVERRNCRLTDAGRAMLAARPSQSDEGTGT